MMEGSGGSWVVVGRQEKWEKKQLQGNPQQALKDKGVIDSGCSRHMTGNISFLLEFEEINGGYVAFRGNPKGGKVGKEIVSAQQYVLLPLWSNGSQDLQNTDDDVTDAAFDVKENENDVYVSANGSDKTDNKKHDEKAKKMIKERVLVNAVSAPVNVVGPNLTNSFNTVSPSVNVVSPNFRIARKSSFVDPSKYPDDPDMHELEDIVYSDDEEDVGAEVDLSNLETNIHVSPILTTRVHKDHHGHTQEEGINYDEVFAPVARIEAIRLFLAYASFMGFMVYQMDVKSAFLYGTIKEEVYVCQPLGFEDPGYPDKVYKVVKALYGLHQAPRAWYETLTNYLLKNGLQRGNIDQTLFIAKRIHFASSGLQVKQKDDGIFISQDKYVAEILRKFGFTNVKSASTPIETEKPLLNDPDGEDVDVHIYRHFITAVSYELMLFGLMKVAAVNLMLLVKKVNDDVQLRALIDSKKVVVSEAIIRRDLHLDDANGVECLLNAEIFKELARMGYEKPPPKLTFYKAVFRNVDSPSKFLMYSRFLQVVLDHQVDDMTTHNTRYISPALTQKVFANMRRFIKGFSCVETPLFDYMLVQPQPQAEEGVEIHIAPAPPSTTSAPSPTDLQDPTPTPHTTPPQDQPPTHHDSPTQDQPTTLHESFMPLLTTLMETSEEEIKEARKEKEVKDFRVKKAEKGRKIASIDADEGIILVDEELDEELDEEKVAMDAESQGRLNQEDVNAASKGVSAVSAPELVSAAKPTVFDDEDIAQKLHGEEVQKATGRDKQERADMERALELQSNLMTNKRILIGVLLLNKVRGITEAYQIFEDMLKGFDREDLVALWNLVKEKFSSVEPSEDKEKALWVELKRQFEPDADDVLWKLQRYMHAPLTCKLYSDCGVHHVSLIRGHDIFMSTEKDYPLSNVVMILMLSGKLQVEEDNEMARDLVMKIFMEAIKLRSKSVDTSSCSEAEYRCVANVVAETCWLQNLLCELHTHLSSATFVYCDNVRVLHVSSCCQYDDIFTKGLPSVLFKEFHTSLRLVSSCFVIFDLEPLSLSFDFVFCSEISKYFPCLSLSSLPPCDLVS
uniref:Reverse transcriptase Ty1/copia-type domain-containing protein n=1 Tax=Tanacetum cinerariifolium TaxID=118510 RepID=A0A6L2NXR3_TANCI|nr:hypothetical protein [Tanacetum cinerariifolium]